MKFLNLKKSGCDLFTQKIKVLLLFTLIGGQFLFPPGYCATIQPQSSLFEQLRTDIGSTNGIFSKANQSFNDCKLSPELKAKAIQKGEGEKLKSSEKKALQKHFECRRARLLNKLCYLALQNYPGALNASYFEALSLIKGNSSQIDGFLDGDKSKSKYLELEGNFDLIRSKVNELSNEDLSKNEWDENLGEGKCGLLKDQVISVGGSRCLYLPELKNGAGDPIVTAPATYLTFDKTFNTKLTASGCATTRTDGTTESRLVSCTSAEVANLCEGKILDEALNCEWVRNDVVACNKTRVQCTKFDISQNSENPAYVCQSGTACVRFQMGSWQANCPTPSPSPSVTSSSTQNSDLKEMRIQRVRGAGGAAKGN